MKLTEFYHEVAKRADTPKVQINAADVSRVLSVMFDVLEDLKPVEAFDLVSKGLASAEKRRR
ncbi:hypothetical protein [Tautonia plasticadhaerens]|uniref:Uncharacterized protein n=1 Tax=Tautonia plasticadhaerens TaxID=2527974 RepID=A0A518H7D9_9BACT|nr:hypothetical protein [Tautonia plasticadhaerens]QDV36676.1 hypothetical protein ElP_46050 [Tautonia plasticadhaerens]